MKRFFLFFSSLFLSLSFTSITVSLFGSISSTIFLHNCWWWGCCCGVWAGKLGAGFHCIILKLLINQIAIQSAYEEECDYVEACMNGKLKKCVKFIRCGKAILTQKDRCINFWCRVVVINESHKILHYKLDEYQKYMNHKP